LIDGEDVALPNAMRAAPIIGTTYWLIEHGVGSAEITITELEWNDDEIDAGGLADGLIFRTEEAAIIALDVLFAYLKSVQAKK